MIAFTAATKPTGGNFNLSGANQTAETAVALPGEQTIPSLERGNYVINATDFTKDEYDQGMARGCQFNHDHFYLPVY